MLVQEIPERFRIRPQLALHSALVVRETKLAQFFVLVIEFFLYSVLSIAETEAGRIASKPLSLTFLDDEVPKSATADRLKGTNIFLVYGDLPDN